VIFLEAFDRLVEQGKIRHYAISTNSLPVLQRFNRDGRCASCQINYSILNQSAALDILPYCLENNIGTLIRGPIAQGVLAGKFTPQSTFDDAVRIGWNEGEGRARLGAFRAWPVPAIAVLQCRAQTRTAMTINAAMTTTTASKAGSRNRRRSCG